MFSEMLLYASKIQEYCIKHLFFNLSIENVPLIATNKLKFCLSVFIISSSFFLLQNINVLIISIELFYTTDQFHNLMTLIYCYNKVI